MSGVSSQPRWKPPPLSGSGHAILPVPGMLKCRIYISTALVRMDNAHTRGNPAKRRSVNRIVGGPRPQVIKRGYTKRRCLNAADLTNGCHPAGHSQAVYAPADSPADKGSTGGLGGALADATRPAARPRPRLALCRAVRSGDAGSDRVSPVRFIRDESLPDCDPGLSVRIVILLSGT